MVRISRSFEVTVRTNRPQDRLSRAEDGNWYAEVRGLPIAGKANERVLKLFSRELTVPITRLKLVRGKHSPYKTVGVIQKTRR